MVAAALHVVGAEVLDVAEAAGLTTGAPQVLGSVTPGFGIWKRTLRIVLSICSSFLYSCSPRLCSAGPSPTCCTRSGFPKETESGITRVTLPSAPCSTVMPSAANRASSASLYVPAGTVGSNSPCTMLWARKPTVANSSVIVGLTCES